MSNEQQKWLEYKIISRYTEIAQEFFPKILGLDPEDVFLTDGLSLLDFVWSPSSMEIVEEEEIFEYFLETTNTLIECFFRVDVKDLEERMLIDIFKRIQQQKDKEKIKNE